MTGLLCCFMGSRGAAMGLLLSSLALLLLAATGLGLLCALLGWCGAAVGLVSRPLAAVWGPLLRLEWAPL